MKGRDVSIVLKGREAWEKKAMEGRMAKWDAAEAFIVEAAKRGDRIRRDGRWKRELIRLNEFVRKIGADPDQFVRGNLDRLPVEFCMKVWGRPIPPPFVLYSEGGVDRYLRERKVVNETVELPDTKDVVEWIIVNKVSRKTATHMAMAGHIPIKLMDRVNGVISGRNMVISDYEKKLVEYFRRSENG